MMEDTSSVW